MSIAQAAAKVTPSMRDPNENKSPPTIAYQSPRVATERAGLPIFRTRFMLVVPRVVQLDTACIKCGCEIGLLYQSGPITAVQVESLAGTRLPKLIVGYWICKKHWHV